jgi:hypothetical protein
MPVPAQYDHEKVVSEMSVQTAWFVEQLVRYIAREKFRKYLNIS